MARKKNTDDPTLPKSLGGKRIPQWLPDVAEAGVQYEQHGRGVFSQIGLRILGHPSKRKKLLPPIRNDDTDFDPFAT
jgi:hypothetical protein